MVALLACIWCTIRSMLHVGGEARVRIVSALLGLPAAMFPRAGAGLGAGGADDPHRLHTIRAPNADTRNVIWPRLGVHDRFAVANRAMSGKRPHAKPAHVAEHHGLNTLHCALPSSRHNKTMRFLGQFLGRKFGRKFCGDRLSH